MRASIGRITLPEPSEKNPAIDEFITKKLGIRRKQAVRRQQCPICEQEAKEFRDERSRREHRISGFCQKCQDRIYKEAHRSEGE